MSREITVKILCYSLVRHALKKDELDLVLPEGSNGLDLQAHIRDLAEGRLDGVPLRVAVNQEFVSDNLELQSGDEVALIPPVQGG